jgi:hypothetical protein
LLNVSVQLANKGDSNKKKIFVIVK